MQKKLLGMAVAAALAAPAVALAQSAVQVYGTIHLSINQTKFTNVPKSVAPSGACASGCGGDVTKYGVNTHASNWGLRSTETLGGGMTAWLQMEFNAQMERRTDASGTGIGATGEGSFRNSGLGLRGNFGNVYVGTWETPWTQTFRFWDVGTIGGWGPVTSIIGRRETTSSGTSRNTGTTGGGLGTSQDMLVTGAPFLNGTQNTLGATTVAGTPVAAGGNTLGYPLWRRFQSAIFYESPLFADVQFKIAYQPNENRSVAGIPENPSAWSASLSWTGLGGRARAFLATMQAKDWSSVGNTDSGWTGGGGYDFGVVNVGATYEAYTYKTGSTAITGVQAGFGDVKAKQWGVGLAVPMGPGKIGASYARAKDLEGLPFSGTGARMWNLGYEWALSKRTALGFGIADINNKNNAGFTWTSATAGPNGPKEQSPVPSGTEQRNIFVSMRHSF
jgi:predicted porin